MEMAGKIRVYLYFVLRSCNNFLFLESLTMICYGSTGYINPQYIVGFESCFKRVGIKKL